MSVDRTTASISFERAFAIVVYPDPGSPVITTSIV